MTNIKNIIFSKDRAAQLDLLLRSIKKNYISNKEDSFTIIYTSSNPEFEKGYSIIKEKHQNILFIKEHENETVFKNLVLNELNSKQPLINFLVDDAVFINPFYKNTAFDTFLNDESISCLSCRLHPDITYTYMQRKNTPKPKMNNNNIWNWTRAAGDWGYPMSLDGHIFKKEDILPILESIKFKNPNTLEHELSRHPINKPNMVCFDNQKLVTIPLNMVQTQYKNNRVSNKNEYDVETLNDNFLNGFLFDLVHLEGKNYNSCHVELALKYI